MRLILALALGLTSSVALAADPTGKWSFNKDSFIAQMNEVMEAQLDTLPEDMRKQVEPMMRQSLEEAMAKETPEWLDFASDGTVKIANAVSVDEGRWEDGGGNEVRLIDGDQVQTAVIEGDQLVLRSEDPSMPEAIIWSWTRQ